MHEDTSSSNNPLSRFVGSWRGEVSVEAAGAEPQRYTQENVWAFTLGGLFLEERGRGSNGSSFIGLWSRDTRTGKYRASYFLAPSGDVVALTYEWLESEHKLVGRAELGDGIRMRTEDHFLDPNTYEWSITVEDSAGKVLTRMFSREQRVK